MEFEEVKKVFYMKESEIFKFEEEISRVKVRII